jgi:uncharacterized protein with PIN domain
VAERGFIVDAMLGTLAKWLRMLGYDTLYSRSYNDAQIISIAARTGRVIVTSDRGLYARAQRAELRAVLLPEANVASNLARLASEGLIELRVDPSLSRCPICNGKLREVTDRNAVRGRVPPGALAKYDKFYVCTRCGHVYWEGGHWVNIRRIVSEARLLLQGVSEGGGRQAQA